MPLYDQSIGGTNCHQVSKAIYFLKETVEYLHYALAQANHELN